MECSSVNVTSILHGSQAKDCEGDPHTLPQFVSALVFAASAAAHTEMKMRIPFGKMKKGVKIKGREEKGRRGKKK